MERGSPILDLGCGCGVPVARRLSARYDVTGVDISPVQVARAEKLVPAARFVCADMSAVEFGPSSFAAVASFYALIHLPLEEQPTLLARIARWLKPGGIFIGTVGLTSWTGTEANWLGVAGGDMWWSHADAATYRRWIAAAGLTIELDEVIREGSSAHALILARR